MANYTIADLSEKTNITNCYVELDDNSPRENKNYGFKTVVGSGNGLATLQNGKLHPSQTPDVRVANPVLVNNIAEMLALDAEPTTVAIVVETNENFILAAKPASVLSNWIQLRDKLGVTSVFGRSTPNIEAQHGDYTTDLVPEGEDPLRKYFTQNRFDDAFALRFPIAFENILVDYRNQPNGVAGLDHLKVVEAADFRLSQDPTQTLKNIYDNANQPNWFVQLDSTGKIGSQYLPPSPSGYTDNDARNALAAPDFDKILGFKNTAVDSASMVSNTANLYIDSSGNEYLQHKIGSTVRNRRFAMHGTDAGFSSASVNMTGTRRGRFQINTYADGTPGYSFANNVPLLINSNGKNTDSNGNLAGAQDLLAMLISGTGGSHFSNAIRFKGGTYIKSGAAMPTYWSVAMSYNPGDEYDAIPDVFRLCAEKATVMGVKTSEPVNQCFFNGSMALYTDTNESYYLAKMRKKDGTYVNPTAILGAGTSEPTLAGVPNNSMTFYTDSTQDYYIARVRKNNGTVAPIGPANLITAGLPSSSNSLPKDALTFFYDERHNVICGARNASAGSMNEEAFAIRASALEPNFDNMLLGGQMQFYVVPNASKFDLYVKIKSMHSNISNTTFKLATSI